MYFSIQFVRQVCSLLEIEGPGEGMHFSKQLSLSFYLILSASIVFAKEAWDQHTLIRALAFVIADSCWICLTMASFELDEDGPILLEKLFMLIVGDRERANLRYCCRICKLQPPLDDVQSKIRATPELRRKAPSPGGSGYP